MHISYHHFRTGISNVHHGIFRNFPEKQQSIVRYTENFTKSKETCREIQAETFRLRIVSLSSPSSLSLPLQISGPVEAACTSVCMKKHLILHIHKCSVYSDSSVYVCESAFFFAIHMVAAHGLMQCRIRHHLQCASRFYVSFCFFFITASSHHRHQISLYFPFYHSPALQFSHELMLHTLTHIYTFLRS